MQTLGDFSLGSSLLTVNLPNKTPASSASQDANLSSHLARPTCSAWGPHPYTEVQKCLGRNLGQPEDIPLLFFFS